MKPDTLFLTLVWTLPILTTLVALLLPKGRDGMVRMVHAVGGALSLALSLVLTFRLYPVLMAEGQTGSLHHVIKLPWFPEWGIQFFVGVDGLSMLLVLLTSVVVFAGILASWKIQTGVKAFFALLQLLAVGVYGVFISFDLFTFFFFYEMEAVAMFLMIGVWGSGRREYGAMKLTLMLMFGSALVLLGILAVHVSAGAQTFDLLELAKVHFDPSLQRWVFPLLFVGFAVSAALFPFHTWSPDGHSAAPTAVSMLAAGVMMKLGAYGCLRVAMVLMPEGAKAWMVVLMVLVSFNVVLGAFIAIRHRDLKFITAYSSISHLGLVLLGLMAGTFLSVKGATLQMISHGFLTGLFFAAIGMIYQRTHTRMLDDMSGLMKPMPFLGVSFVLAGFAGLGLPGFSGFVAELTVFLGVAQNKEPLARVLAVLSILGITTTAVYVIRTANFMLGGPFRLVHRDGAGHEHVVTDVKASGLTDADPIEKAALVLLIGCLLAMGLFPGWIMNMLDTTLVPLMAAMAK